METVCETGVVKRSERRSGKAGNGEDAEFTSVNEQYSLTFALPGRPSGVRWQATVRAIFQRRLAKRSSFTAPV
ncbi:hypothetical protein PSEUDO8AS_20132 [Pseudomonas sp. 8AS]|nr:hypothetical protein PSEUDO8AS_20132 [Pseudomonas sp. 8AS]